MLPRAVAAFLVVIIRTAASAYVESDTPQTATAEEAAQEVEAPLVRTDCDEDDRIGINDPDVGPYTSCLGRLTRREQVLSIIEDLPHPCQRERPAVLELGPCRYELTLPDGRRVMTPPGWGCLMLPTVKARVDAIGAGRFRYRYAFRNARQADDDIWSFEVDLPRGNILLDRSDAQGWLLLDLGGVPLYLGPLQEKTGRPVAMWAPKRRYASGCMSDRDPLRPGERVSGLALTTAYLPALTQARFTDHVCLGTSPNEDLVSARPIPGAQDVSFCAAYEVRRPVISPMLSPPGPEPASRTRILTRLGADLGFALGARWIENEPARWLGARLESAAREPSDTSALSHLAGEIETRAGISSGYRGALLVTLRALAGPP